MKLKHANIGIMISLAIHFIFTGIYLISDTLDMIKIGLIGLILVFSPMLFFYKKRLETKLEMEWGTQSFTEGITQ
jgi:hypothetical protein